MKKKFVTTWAFAFWTTSAIASAPCQVWWSQVWWKCRYIFFDLSRDITVAIKLKGHVTLKVGLSHGKSTLWLVFYPHVLCKCRYNAFNLSCDLKRPHDELFKRQYQKMVKHTQTIPGQIADELFECVWPFCGIGAYRVKDSCKFMDRSSFGYITTLTSLVNINIVIVEI